MPQSHQQVLELLLESQRSHEFSILKISEPISGPSKQISKERASDVSADIFENPSPASLEADLAHYKACFSQIRQPPLLILLSIGTIFQASILVP